MESWAMKRRLVAEESEAESVLSMVPSFDPYKAQLILSSTSLRDFILMRTEDKKEKFVWLTEEALVRTDFVD